MLSNWIGWARRGVQPEDGQDLVEYALLAALISIVAIAGILLVGPAIVGEFQAIVSGLGMA